MSLKYFLSIFLQIIIIKCQKQDQCITKIVKMYTKFDSVIYLINFNTKFNFPVIYQDSSQLDFTLFQYRKPDMYIIKMKIQTKQILEFLSNFEIFNPRALFIILIETNNYEMYFQKLTNLFIYHAILINSHAKIVTSDNRIYNCNNRILKEKFFFQNDVTDFWKNTTIPAVFYQDYPYLFLEGNNLRGFFYNYFATVQKFLGFKIKASEFINGGYDNRSTTLGQFQNFCFD